MSTRSYNQNKFDLEALEPRVLLSGSPLPLVALSGGGDSTDIQHSAEQVSVPENQPLIGANPAASIDDIFGGLEGTNLENGPQNSSADSGQENAQSPSENRAPHAPTGENAHLDNAPLAVAS